ncbi:bifunctional Armadillo-like helical/HEAT [Babesia duncani]|uniref:Bifunctional Armadillo-like helical/HEAT n=1 Tax=Babesia duncani TaxID=323732 RepID=A0AAD9PP51_9APIC|nr:bifunctional Armadillo-like helical/HEAT [Babesia duncani]
MEEPQSPSAVETEFVNALSKCSISSNASIERFKKYIADGDVEALEALKNIKLVLDDINEDSIVKDLIPFIFGRSGLKLDFHSVEMQYDFDNPLLFELCDAWCIIAKYLSRKNIGAVFVGFEFLASKEDPPICDKAIDSLISVLVWHANAAHASAIQNTSTTVSGIEGSGTENSTPPEALSLVDEYVVPMIERMATSTFFSGEMSACKLIPKVYKMASESNKCELRKAFQQICESSYLIVKITAARNLTIFISMIEMEHAISMFWLVLKNMAVELQEEVRACAVEACLEFSKRCTPEQNASLNYPVIKAAVEDNSWKVRKATAMLFEKIYQVFGEDEVYEHLLDLHLALLRDPNDNVKLPTIENFSKWAGICNLKSIERYLPTLDPLARFASMETRRHICHTLALFAMKISKEDRKRILYPTMIYFFNHPCMEVRLCVVQHIHFVCDREEFGFGIGDKLMETIDIALEGRQWRHRLLLAEQLTGLFSHFGEEIFCTHFTSVIFRLLMDTVWKVRNVLLSSLEKIFVECGDLWVHQVILPELKTMYLTPNVSPYVGNSRTFLPYAHKITILQALQVVAPNLTLEMCIEEICPIYSLAAQDLIPNVRIIVAKVIERFIQINRAEDPMIFYPIKCTLTALANDEDSDVRYYSNMALDTFTECFGC